MNFNEMESVKNNFSPLPKHSVFPLATHPSPSTNPYFVSFLINNFASTPEVNVFIFIFT